MHAASALWHRHVGRQTHSPSYSGSFSTLKAGTTTTCKPSSKLLSPRLLSRISPTITQALGRQRLGAELRMTFHRGTAFQDQDPRTRTPSLRPQQDNPSSTTPRVSTSKSVGSPTATARLTQVSSREVLAWMPICPSRRVIKRDHVQQSLRGGSPRQAAIPNCRSFHRLCGSETSQPQHARAGEAEIIPAYLCNYRDG